VGFIQVVITDAMLREAERMAQEMGELRNSIMEGRRNVAGFLGELCFRAAFPKAIRANTYDFDLLLNGKSIEVKTKERTVRPQPHYDCTVPAYNTRQKADFYVFVSLLRAKEHYTEGFLLGFIRPEEFRQKATLLRENEVYPANGIRVRADCYNLPVSQLRQFS
jgi:hypothetical protein